MADTAEISKLYKELQHQFLAATLAENPQALGAAFADDGVFDSKERDDMMAQAGYPTEGSEQEQQAFLSKWAGDKVQSPDCAADIKTFLLTTLTSIGTLAATQPEAEPEVATTSPEQTATPSTEHGAEPIRVQDDVDINTATGEELLPPKTEEAVTVDTTPSTRPVARPDDVVSKDIVEPNSGCQIDELCADFLAADTPLAKGAKGKDVLAVQQALLAAGEKLPEYGPDSDFGSETEAALKSFQSKNGLEATGVLNDNTKASLQKHLENCRVSLINDKVEAEVVQQSAERVKETVEETKNACDRFESLNGKFLMGGHEGEDVKTLQNSLNTLGYEVGAEGQFEAKTVEALKNFQNEAKIEVDGMFGKQSYAAMNNALQEKLACELEKLDVPSLAKPAVTNTQKPKPAKSKAQTEADKVREALTGQSQETNQSSIIVEEQCEETSLQTNTRVSDPEGAQCPTNKLDATEQFRDFRRNGNDPSPSSPAGNDPSSDGPDPGGVGGACCGNEASIGDVEPPKVPNQKPNTEKRTAIV